MKYFCFHIGNNLLIIGGNIDSNTLMKTEIINYFDKDLDCTPMDPIIFDTYLEGATGGVINKIPIICNGYSKSGRPDKCWNIQTAKEIATTSVERRYAASIVLSQNEKQKVII